MEEMLRSVAPVGDEQLRQLADARAQAVYETARSRGPGRARLHRRAAIADGIKDDGVPSRVEFSLK